MKKNIFFFLLLTVIVFTACKKSDVKPKETVLYETDFSSNDGKWGTGTPSNGIVLSISDGYYTFRNSSTGSYGSWLENPVFTGTPARSAIEASIKTAQTGNDGWGSGGLLWNLKKISNNNYYEFGFVISYNGKFEIYGYPNGDQDSYTEYVSWTLSSAIKTDSFNKLRITLTTGTLHFFINDKEVHSMPATSEGALDLAGFIADRGTTLQMDYFRAVTF
ncbi:hypothetical protein A8C56_14270 [Niabella ginsenosidivorans]|uniref:3-keto-disaccharide hydrolase domain-containing protein n=1 Tax=Niabella ginsenosidivorans TaxID=1176587 RepID=A0A1A9I4K4_9BACT|nr:hypothetical protein [Niabella ginsenosidivorans]ANH81979.1 hypothetical protein A8C56_14270 [Niabella ginsenosidivorans]